MKDKWLEWETDGILGKWYEHVYWAIRYGDWSAGCKSKAQWKNKPYFKLCRMYYDGVHVALHVWRFYIGVSY